MWISRLQLNSFKSYQSQKFEFPKPEGERNIVLIGGLNGYGKTSILEALYLCLYGKDAMAHLARAGLKLDDKAGYPTFLEKAFNGETLRMGGDTMTVKMEIAINSFKSVEITRKWFFRSNGTWDDEEATVRFIVRGTADAPLADGKDNFYLSAVLDEIFVPAHIAPFFFFDGEEVKKLADQTRVEQVKQGLEGLLGVVLLRSLIQRLKSYESSRRGSFSTVDEKELLEKEQQIAEGERKLGDLRKQAQEFEEQKAELTAGFNSLLSRITSIGGATANTATFKDLIEEREQWRQKQREGNISLESLLTDRLPFQLASLDLRRKLREQLEGELKLLKWHAEKAALQPRQREFEASFRALTEPPIDPPLNEVQSQAVLARVSAAWASLFFPPPSDCAPEIYHDYLSANDRETILTSLSALSVNAKQITGLLQKQEEYQSRIDDLNRDINRLEGIENDGTLNTLKAELDDVRRRMEEVDSQNNEVQRHITSLDARVQSDRSSYENRRRLHDASSPQRALLNKSERVRSVIEELIPELFPLKVKALASAMTSVYKKLAHKSQVSKIQIRDDGTTIVFGGTGKPITFDRSAGENQIFATALIAGLAKVSGIKAPMVVDTPLGRLDSKHRNNIVDFWLSDTDRQVILLSQDEEIDADFLKRIKRSVSKTYLLEHQDVGDGVGRTTAKANAYFGAGA